MLAIADDNGNAYLKEVTDMFSPLAGRRALVVSRFTHAPGA